MAAGGAPACPCGAADAAVAPNSFLSGAAPGAKAGDAAGATAAGGTPKLRGATRGAATASLAAGGTGTGASGTGGAAFSGAACVPGDGEKRNSPLPGAACPGLSIVGATSMTQLEEDVAAAQGKLDTGTLREIQEIQQRYPNPAA